MPLNIWGFLQATITDAGQGNGRGVPGGLHALTADFDTGRLLAWLTAESAHSVNLWMQQRQAGDSAHALSHRM